MRYDEDTKLLLTEVHDHAAHDAAALPDASFSLITFSCPLAEETDAPTGTPTPTPMLTAVPESALAPFNVVLPEDAHVEMAEGRITLVRGIRAWWRW